MAGKKPYDDLETDYLEEENESGFLSLVSVVIAFIAVAVFIALAWYAYQSNQSDNGSEEIEVVYPEDGPVREAPEETGGWQFPHQDKSVYNISSNEGEQPEEAKVEQILPAPEQPMRQPSVETKTWMNGRLKQGVVAETDAERLKEAQALEAQAQIATAETEEKAETKEAPVATEVAGAVTNTPEKASVEQSTEPTTPATTEAKIAETTESAPEPTPAPVVAVKVKAKPVPQPAPKAQPKPVMPKPVVPKPVVKAPPAPVAMATGNVKLQLGAVSSEAEARTQWNRIRARFSTLSNKSLVVQSVNANGKTLYRIQASGFANVGMAKSACSQLSNSGQACFVVAR